MFDRILVPLDGSARAEQILAQVGKVLRRRDSELILVRVIPPLRLAGQAEQHLYWTERGRAESHLRDTSSRLVERGARARWIVEEGSPAECILEAARCEACTLVAMATHGRSGVARWALGSVAERVVRASNVPVLMVRSFRGGTAPPGDQELTVRTILVPTDGSRSSESAFDPALECADFFGAEVVVLQVQDIVASPSAYAVPYGGPIGPAPSQEVAQEWARRFSSAGVQARVEIVSGDAASQIIDRADELGNGLVVMATHGLSGISRWLVGSVTERVLRATDTPLIIVRSPNAPEETESQKLRRYEHEPQHLPEPPAPMP